MKNKKAEIHIIGIILITMVIILFGGLIIFIFILGISKLMEINEEGRMAEQLCKENNLIFVEDYWGKGNHCAKIEDNIITRYFPEKLNDEEFYLIKR